MEEDIQNYSPTFMFRGTPCICLTSNTLKYCNTIVVCICTIYHYQVIYFNPAWAKWNLNAWILLGPNEMYMLESCLNPAWILLESSLNPAWILFESSLNPAWILLESCLNPVWILLESCLNPAWILLESCFNPAWILLESCLNPAWILLESCLNPA